MLKKHKTEGVSAQMGGDEQSQMIKMMVDQSKMLDEIHLKTGVENEDFENSLSIFVRTDPEVKQLVMQQMQKM